MRSRRPLGATSVRDALDSAEAALSAAGCDTARLDAEILLAAAMGVARAALVAGPDTDVPPEAARRFAEWARRRRGREPVAYILGRKGFRRLDLAVDRRVLVPRPETEHLVEAALGLGLAAGARVVDVGTGSGAIALSLKDERPDLEVVGVDSSGDALDVARANARGLGLEVTLLQGDLLEPVAGPVDVVVSNPPYVEERLWGELPPEVSVHEPAEALRGGSDGLEVYRRLCPAAAASGAPDLALEIGSSQADAVVELVRKAGFAHTRVLADLAGLDRVVVGRR